VIFAQYSIDPKVRFQWPTIEPFLFCVHHLDHYPKMHINFGPHHDLLKNRNLGEDFETKDGFRMYHGKTVPGFPAHPHRGFETITIVRQGYVDHADSMQASGRYGPGDVQWMTAGAGVQHSEMFPLLKRDQANPVELFQIWLNLPRQSKFAQPHFKMFWSEALPKWKSEDGKARVEVICGDVYGVASLRPPPDSWAAKRENDVQILLIEIDPNGSFILPKGKNASKRLLYFYGGDMLVIRSEVQAEIRLPANTALDLDVSTKVELFVPSFALETAKILLLQAQPIGEPVVQYGPFVMNSKEEIFSTIQDYQQTHFGGWSWSSPDPVHGELIERFAKFPDGRIEKPRK
jgi:redox-sensitive bicupin YhaK (pirin superfamily)